MATTSADQVLNFLSQEGQRISTNINQKLKAKASPFLNIIKKEFWEDGIGESPQTFVWRRGTTDSEAQWTDIDMDDAGNGTLAAESAGPANCLPPSEEVNFVQEHRNYNLQHKAIWGPRICVNQLRSKFALMQQMEATVKSLADYARYTWVLRNRDEYKRVSGSKVIASASGISFNGEAAGDFGSGVVNMTEAQYDADLSNYSRLTNDITDYAYEYLNHMGAQDGALSSTGGRPIYGLITSARQSRNLIKEDPDVREDFRYSGQNEKLLEAMGVKYTYNGYTHLINDHPARYNLAANLAGSGISATVSSGVLTFSSSVSDVTPRSEIILYAIADGAVLGRYLVTGETTAGTVYTVVNSDGTTATNAIASDWIIWKYVPEFLSGLANPNWLTATFEDSYVFHQDAMTCLVPKPMTSAGQAKFDPVNYSGDFSWRNYADEVRNPDGTMGRFRGVLSSGTRPDNPEFAITIRHLSCAGAINDLVNCNGTASA